MGQILSSQKYFIIFLIFFAQKNSKFWKYRGGCDRTVEGSCEPPRTPTTPWGSSSFARTCGSSCEPPQPPHSGTTGPVRRLLRYLLCIPIQIVRGIRATFLFGLPICLVCPVVRLSSSPMTCGPSALARAGGYSGNAQNLIQVLCRVLFRNIPEYSGKFPLESHWKICWIFRLGT